MTEKILTQRPQYDRKKEFRFYTQKRKLLGRFPPRVSPLLSAFREAQNAWKSSDRK